MHGGAVVLAVQEKTEGWLSQEEGHIFIVTRGRGKRMRADMVSHEGSKNSREFSLINFSLQ